jgi:hypothetical protein
MDSHAAFDKVVRRMSRHNCLVTAAAAAATQRNAME